MSYTAKYPPPLTNEKAHRDGSNRREQREPNSPAALFFAGATEKPYPAITALVNNAGLGSAGKLLDANIDDLESMIYLNVTALTRLAQEFTRLSKRFVALRPYIQKVGANFPSSLNDRSSEIVRML